MEIDSAAGLFIATFLLGLSPGPAVFATLGRAISLGLRPTFLFIIGIIIGDLLFSLMAMLGLALIASQYGIIFTAIKIIGSMYLIYLGLQSLRNSNKIDIHTHHSESNFKLISSGFILTASNPKDLLFFVSFLPAFMDLEEMRIDSMAMASMIIVLAFLITLSFYALLAHHIRKIFKHNNTLKYLHYIAGLTLICVGCFILIS